LASGARADLGGKGANQAVVLARSGVPTRLVSRIGQDAAAARLRVLLSAEPLGVSGVMTTDLPTDPSIVLRAENGEHCIVSTAANAHAPSEADVVAAVRAGNVDVMVVLQGSLTQAATTRTLEEARARGLRTVLTPAPTAPRFVDLWPLVDLVVLNAGEARELSGPDDPGGAAERIRAAGAGRVVVTLGQHGALLRDADGLVAVGTAPAEVRDTTGAGDTFTVVLAAALLACGHDVRAALTAAALTVSRVGTLASFPTRQELAAILGGS
jgi:ribokinase